MAKASQQKLKTLYVLRMFFEETDENIEQLKGDFYEHSRYSIIKSNDPYKQIT